MVQPVLSAGDGGENSFDEPWQVRAFAIVNLLVQHGVLTASDWSNCLGSKRRVDDAVDQGYWQDWLATVEDFLANKGILTSRHIENAVAAIDGAREHRHPAAPEPLFIDPAQTECSI